MMMIRFGRRCDCFCGCEYRAARKWQGGRCYPCTVGAHHPKPADPDRGHDGARIVQARRVPPVGF